ncbi:MAG: hypothetical protein ACR2PV_07880 [Gammaproteobacteria bacterium]
MPHQDKDYKVKTPAVRIMNDRLIQPPATNESSFIKIVRRLLYNSPFIQGAADD